MLNAFKTNDGFIVAYAAIIFLAIRALYANYNGQPIIFNRQLYASHFTATKSAKKERREGTITSLRVLLSHVFSFLHHPGMETTHALWPLFPIIDTTRKKRQHSSHF